MDELTQGVDLEQLVRTVIERSGLISYYEKERGERGQARIENLGELVTAARSFDPQENLTFNPPTENEEELSLLDEFLSHASLEAGEAQGDSSEDCVQLMTMHSAKGLEFPLVFLAGMEEGLFPHRMSLEEPGRLEEERRLCYVGVTRAMRHLYLTHAETRRLNGTDNYNRLSRFITEIPEELIQEVRLKNTVVHAPNFKLGKTEGEFSLGQRVHHAKFGEGVVLNYEGQGKQARVHVNFSEGSKWLMVSFANLQTVK